MSLEVFSPLEFLKIVWDTEVLVFLRMFSKIHVWSYLVQSFFGEFFFIVTALISLGIICLFRFSYYFWLSFGRLYVSRNLSISSRLSNLLAYCCSQYFLTILCICLVSVVIYFSFLILFICIFSLFFGVSCEKFVNLVFLIKEPMLGFIDLLYCVF